MLLSALCAAILFIKILQSAACKEYIGEKLQLLCLQDFL